MLQLAPRAGERAPRNAYASTLGLALSRQNFNELLLAVAGYAGDADDLAAAHREARTGDGARAAVTQRVEMLDLEVVVRNGWCGPRCALRFGRIM